MKCIKNKQEIQGFINCHKRDGAVLAIAFSYLEEKLNKNEKINEYEFAIYLDKKRCEGKMSKGISFETISASGSNGAIVHYKPSESDNKQIEIQNIFLCDSGGQYLDGTTDVTRTFNFNLKKEEQENYKEVRDRYTRVLLGNLDIEKLRWPSKQQINGSNVDVLARRRLWEINEDFGHGTGHGVGSYLCVHEGPHGINLRTQVPFKAGMIVTDEPGYYK